MRFLIECDTGMGRNGVQTPDAALELAKKGLSLPRMQFEGLMTFPSRHPNSLVFFSSKRSRCSSEAGIGARGPAAARRPSSAYRTSPCSRSTAPAPHFNDVMTVASGTATWDNCAARACNDRQPSH